MLIGYNGLKFNFIIIYKNKIVWIFEKNEEIFSINEV